MNKLFGKNNPFYGKKHKKETIEKFRKIHLELYKDKTKHPRWKGGIPKCIDCGKKKKCYYGLRCRPCNDKYRIGENNPNWQNGSSFKPYSSLFNKQLRDKMRVRDNFICQVCGIPELECLKKLSIHHIDFDKLNCNENNLISLCSNCHSKTQSKRKQWKEYFQNKMEVYHGR